MQEIEQTEKVLCDICMNVTLDFDRKGCFYMFVRGITVSKVILVCVSLHLAACTNMFFQPLKQHVASPEQYNIKYEDIVFEGEDGLKLHGWWFSSSRSATRSAIASIIFLHGNGENISTHAGLVHWITQHNYDVFIFDYRGYGKSEGKAEIKGVMQDIQSARDYVKSNRPDTHKVFIIGHSLGASMGIYNAAIYKDDIDGIILVSPFSSYPLIARETMNKSWLTWAFQWPLSLAIGSEYDPINFVALLPDKPKLFIYSENDQVIGSGHVVKLYNKAKGEKYLQKTNGSHNSIFSKEMTQKTILRYLDQWSE